MVGNKPDLDIQVSSAWTKVYKADIIWFEIKMEFKEIDFYLESISESYYK